MLRRARTGKPGEFSRVPFLSVFIFLDLLACCLFLWEFTPGLRGGNFQQSGLACPGHPCTFPPKSKSAHSLSLQKLHYSIAYTIISWPPPPGRILVLIASDRQASTNASPSKSSGLIVDNPPTSCCKRSILFRCYMEPASQVGRLAQVVSL